MDNVTLNNLDQSGRGFIPKPYLPKDKDEFYLRDEQSGKTADYWRPLTEQEIEQLIHNSNRSETWDHVWVHDTFDPDLVQHSEFVGSVRIGCLKRSVLSHDDMQMPVGITHSRIIACDLGDDVAIHHVHYLAHTLVGDRCLLMNIGEMLTTDRARFGMGSIKDGESEEDRLWIDLVNESGSRGVLPFDTMIAADAALWVRYRDDDVLMNKLIELTQSQGDGRRGYYSTVGHQCVIKHCRTLKDVKIGSHTHVHGAERLENVTIQSSQNSPAEIGEGVILTHGIVSEGCCVLSAAQANRFVLGDSATLEQGARVSHTFVGDNATIGCGEVRNSLIFPGHEQHHNNSFLIGAWLMGQSNLAAGATIGSNHNSRANDLEVQAGRGFWSGLCTNVKHPSRFASFVLLAKGEYPNELNIPLPFSLVSHNVTADRLEVSPAFWWRHNMYALMRNAWKFPARDRRVTPRQHIEFSALAPDTIQEIVQARYDLELWTAKARLNISGQSAPANSEEDLAKEGRQFLAQAKTTPEGLAVLGEGMERSQRPVSICSPVEGYQAYEEMLYVYVVDVLIDYLDTQGIPGPDSFSGESGQRWMNLGGQLIPLPEIDRLRADIRDGTLASWEAVHQRYDTLWESYPSARECHAYDTLCSLLQTEHPDRSQWIAVLDKTERIRGGMLKRVISSRQKDYDNPFIQATYLSAGEMTAAIGTINENAVISRMEKETQDFRQRVQALKDRL